MDNNRLIRIIVLLSSVGYWVFWFAYAAARSKWGVRPYRNFLDGVLMLSALAFISLGFLVRVKSPGDRVVAVVFFALFAGGIMYFCSRVRRSELETSKKWGLIKPPQGEGLAVSTVRNSIALLITFVGSIAGAVAASLGYAISFLFAKAPSGAVYVSPSAHSSQYSRGLGLFLFIFCIAGIIVGCAVAEALRKEVVAKLANTKYANPPPVRHPAGHDIDREGLMNSWGNGIELEQ